MVKLVEVHKLMNWIAGRDLGSFLTLRDSVLGWPCSCGGGEAFKPGEGTSTSKPSGTGGSASKVGSWTFAKYSNACSSLFLECRMSNVECRM